MKFTSEISLKIRTAITVKLAELGNDVYEELPDYIMVMVANKKSKEQMSEDLALFLGDITDQFTSWLHTLVSKLQSVASESAGAKGVRAKAVKNTIRPSATPRDSDSEHFTPDFNEDASFATPNGSDEASTSCMNSADDSRKHESFYLNSTDDSGKRDSDDLNSTDDAENRDFNYKNSTDDSEKREFVESKHTTADADSTSKLTNLTSSSNPSLNSGNSDTDNVDNNGGVVADRIVTKRKMDSETKSLKGKSRKVDPTLADEDGAIKVPSPFLSHKTQKHKNKGVGRTSDIDRKTSITCNQSKSPSPEKESLPNGPGSEVTSSGKPTEVFESEELSSSKDTDPAPSESETTDEKSKKAERT